MKPHESPRIRKNQLVAIRAIRGLCGIGVLESLKHTFCFDSKHISSKSNINCDSDRKGKVLGKTSQVQARKSSTGILSRQYASMSIF